MYALAGLRELQAELRRRAKVIRELPRTCARRTRSRPSLASKKSLGLHPIVIGVDECQMWFEHAEYGAEIEEIVTDLVKRGPATGHRDHPGHAAPGREVHPDRDQRQRHPAVLPQGHRPDRQRHGVGHLSLQERRASHAVLLRGTRESACSRASATRRTTVKTVDIDGPDAEALIALALGRRASSRAADRLRRWPGRRRGRDRVGREHAAADLLTVFGDADKRWSESLVDALADCSPTSTARGPSCRPAAAPRQPSSPPRSSRSASPPSRCGAPTRRPARAPTAMGVERDHIADALTERDKNVEARLAPHGSRSRGLPPLDLEPPLDRHTSLISALVPRGLGLAHPKTAPGGQSR